MLVLTLTACAVPEPQTATPATSSAQCAYVEARQARPEISARLTEKLKQAALPLETARAEAYGENCIAADNSIVSFSQRETDFYVTLNTPNLADEASLGRLLEKTLVVIAQFPPDELGPGPGYIGITFQAGSQVKNLWFTQTRADDLRKQGLKGIELYQALANNP